MAKNRKTKQPSVSPYVQSPTWGQLQQTADRVISVLGGPRGAANKLNSESFLTLTILASLALDDEKAAAPIFGVDRLT